MQARRCAGPECRAISDHALRSSGGEEGSPRARGMEDRAGAIDGVEIGVIMPGRVRLDPDREDGKGGDCPSFATRRRNGGYRRDWRRRVSRAQGTRTGSRPLRRRLVFGRGDALRQDSTVRGEPNLWSIGTGRSRNAPNSRLGRRKARESPTPEMQGALRTMDSPGRQKPTISCYPAHWPNGPTPESRLCIVTGSEDWDRR